MGQKREQRSRVGFFLVTATSMAVAWASVPAGRATSDSASYLDGARHLAAGEGYTSAHVRIASTALRPIVDFGPGYSLLMVPGIRAGLDVRQSAALVLGASYVLYAVALYGVLLEVSGGRWWGIVFFLSAVLTLHPGVLLLLDTIGSDLPAAAFFLSAVYFAMRLLKEPEPSLASAFGIGICMSLALLTRWSMLYLLIGLSVGLLISLPPAWSDRRRQITAVVLLVPLLTVMPWLVRNYMTTRTVLGYRRIAFANPFHLAAAALAGIGSGSSVGHLKAGLEIIRQVCTGVFSALFVFVFVSRRCWREPAVRLALVSAATYFVLLVLSASVNPIDPLSAQRFWVPMWPLLAAVVLGSLISIGTEAGVGRLVFVAFVVQLLLDGGDFGADFLRSLPTAASGRGFFQQDLAQSAPIRFVQSNQSNCLLLSNDPRIVLMYRGVARVHDLPDSADELRPLLQSRAVCIVLFTKAVTAGVRTQLPAGRDVLGGLQREGLVSRIDGDDAGEVWHSIEPGSERISND